MNEGKFKIDITGAKYVVEIDMGRYKIVIDDLSDLKNLLEFMSDTLKKIENNAIKNKSEMEEIKKTLQTHLNSYSLKQIQGIDKVINALLYNLKIYEENNYNSAKVPNLLEEHPEFLRLLQDKTLNDFSNANLQKNKVLNLLDQSEIKVNETLTLRLTNPNLFLKKGQQTTSRQFWDIMLSVYTKLKDPLIIFPLNEYMSLRDIKDEKTARQQVREGIEFVKSIEFETTEKTKKNEPRHTGYLSLYGGTGTIRNGYIYLRLNPDFTSFLNLSSPMYYSKETLAINTKKNPNAYYFSHYIDENYRLNEGRKREETIKIKTLLSRCPTMPTQEEVRTTDRHYFQRIITPTIRDLDILDRLHYDFYDKNNNLITDPDITFKNNPELFFTSKIKIDYSEYPQNIKRRAKQEKDRKKGGNHSQKRG